MLESGETERDCAKLTVKFKQIIAKEAVKRYFFIFNRNTGILPVMDEKEHRHPDGNVCAVTQY